MNAVELTFATPTTLSEALAELASEDAMAVGGGTSVALLLKNQLVEPAKLVWLGRVPELRGLALTAGGDLRVGSGTTLRELTRVPEVRERLPVLAEAASHVGNPRVRAVATVGGALAHADPRQDLPPVLLALGATVHVAGPGGRREVPMRDFFTGWMETALSEGELVTEVRIPLPPRRRAAYARFTPGSDDDYPTVAVAATIDFRPDGSVEAAAVAVGGVADRPLLVPDAGALLADGPDRTAGARPGPADIAAVADAAAAAARPSDDNRGSAEYKKAMTGVWTRRVLERALGH